MKATRGMVGRRFGMLTVTRLLGKKDRALLWECLCDCGAKTSGRTGHLNAGNKVSCGCVPSGRKNAKHGLAHSPEYRAWENARSRCRNPKNKKYQLYGGRGIGMCAEWEQSFDAFIADMGRRPAKGWTLDRIDSNGHYEPSNCRWATYETQNNNRPSFNRYLVVDGKKMSVAQAGRFTGLPHATILDRLNAGKTDSEVIKNA